MGSSKQLSNGLKNKIIHYHGLGEGYKKHSQRFHLSILTVRNVVRRWKATGTVAVKPRSGRQPTDHLQRPATTSGCRWCICTSFNYSTQFAQRTSAWPGDDKEALTVPTPQV